MSISRAKPNVTPSHVHACHPPPPLPPRHSTALESGRKSLLCACWRAHSVVWLRVLIGQSHLGSGTRGSPAPRPMLPLKWHPISHCVDNKLCHLPCTPPLTSTLLFLLLKHIGKTHCLKPKCRKQKRKTLECHVGMCFGMKCALFNLKASIRNKGAWDVKNILGMGSAKWDDISMATWRLPMGQGTEFALSWRCCCVTATSSQHLRHFLGLPNANDCRVGTGKSRHK